MCSDSALYEKIPVVRIYIRQNTIFRTPKCSVRFCGNIYCKLYFDYSGFFLFIRVRIIWHLSIHFIKRQVLRNQIKYKFVS